MPLQRRFENALAWILSIEDPAKRKEELALWPKFPGTSRFLYGDLASVIYQGERTSLAGITGDIYASVSGQYPKFAVRTNAPESDPVSIYVDIIEDRQKHNSRVRLFRTLESEESSSRPAPGNAMALYTSGAFWILIAEEFIFDLMLFFENLFRHEGVREVLRMDRLSKIQWMLVEGAALRIAVETLIEHETGHIRNGHYTPGNRTFREYAASVKRPVASSEDEWNLATETIADDRVGYYLGMATAYNAYATFPVTDELKDIGPFVLLNATLIAIFGFFAVAEMHTDSRRRTERKSAGYPSIATRLRLVYDSFTLRLQKVLKDPKVLKQMEDAGIRPTLPLDLNGLTLENKLRLVNEALSRYLNDLDFEQFRAQKRPELKKELKEAVLWVDSPEEDSKRLGEINSLIKNMECHQEYWEPYSYLRFRRESHA